MADHAKPILNEAQQLLKLMNNDTFIQSVDRVGMVLKQGCNNQKTIFIAGNGGSWADADHFAGELRAQFEIKGRQALPALALPISLSTLTAWGNDYDNGFELAMKRDLEALAKQDDILIAISTSGKAKNVRTALTWAHEHGLVCITISGHGPESKNFSRLADHSIIIPHEKTARIQEAYQIVIHILCRYIDAIHNETA